MRYKTRDWRLQSTIGTVKMIPEISSKLNRRTRRYRYLDICTVTVIVKNNCATPITVFESSVLYNNKQLFTKVCDVKVLPGKICKLPSIKFTIGLWANYWSNTSKIKIGYRETNNKTSEMKYSSVWGEYIIIKNAAKKHKRIFVSHSNTPRDDCILEKTTSVLTKIGFTPYVAEFNFEKRPLWQKIWNKIHSSDLFVTLYTKDGIKSGDVREENGIAFGMSKQKIAIVEEGMSAPGSHLGLEYVSVDVENLDESLQKFANLVLSLTK